MKYFTKYFTILLFCVCNYQLQAQIYNFRTYNEDNGLPQNYIYKITQNKQGFLFLSTGAGFSAFGGTKFQNFTIKDSLCENFITTHFEDSRGITWIGHFQDGISILKDYSFSKIKKSDLFGSKIIAFAEDKAKNIWFVVQGKGIYYIDTSFTIRNPVFPGDFMPTCIATESSGGLMCGTDDGLFWYDIENPNKPRLICNNPDFENKSIKSIIRDTRNSKSMWLTIQNEGVYGITLNGNCFSVSTSITKELDSDSKNIVTTYSDKNSNLWISLADEGLRKITFLDRKNQGAYTVQKINKKNGLPNLYIESILEDFEGNFWFGTFGEGLIEMPVEKFIFNKPEISSDIKAIQISKFGSFFCGTPLGLLKYNLQNDENSVLYNQKNGFVNDAVTCLFEDSNGLLWIGNQNNGLYTYNVEKEKFENFSKKNNLSILSINCITETKDKKILIGTIEGVYTIDLKNSSISLLTTMEGLLHNNVRHLFCDSKNRTWFSSYRTPSYYLENLEFTVLQNIESIAINSVNEDQKGTIWISTDGDGLYTYDGHNFNNYTVTEGLLSNYCYSSVQTKGNETWVTHKNGLSIINNYTKSIKTITKLDGLLFTENNINSTFIDVKKDLWLGTATGLVKYNADQASLMKIPPITNILRFSANETIYKVGDEILLPYDKYSIKINFIGISFIDPTRVNYKYRLLGHDTTWRYTNEKVLEFQQIADGKYTFQVFAANRDGVWSTNPCEITFEIKLPFWKKVWFWLLTLIVLSFLVFVIIRQRVKGLIKEKEFLESKISEKTYQLQIEKEQLESIKIILEEKSKDITDSINYAKRIQESLLPTEENFLKNFPKSFIYFKPRDIVSGDFYWFAETEHSFVIAVIDCTGHGIPGAFMSIIGSTILTDIVIDKKITSPGEILNQLNKNIIISLKQDSEGSSSRDGMDVSICSINKTKTKMQYSSASRPMYYVRNNILNEVNLKLFSIGGSYEDQDKTYSNIEIDLMPDDIFYFFTDGYTDQFNETDDKKFSSKRLKNLFIEIATLNPTNQYKIVDDTFNEWKGGRNQIDDITIVGFKI